MPPDRRTLRDIRSAYEGMRRYQFQTGQWVLWFRQDKASTTAHPIYDTGPQRVWFAPVTIPILLGEYHRAERNFDDDGLYLVDRLHLTMSYDMFFHAESALPSSVRDPDPTGLNHVTDRLIFDNHIFSVVSFLPQGRVADYFLTISVDAIEVAQEEMDEDASSYMFTPFIVAS